LTPLIALVLRVGALADQWHDFQNDLIVFTLASLVVKPLILYLAGMYRRYWRYASIGELYLLGLAVLCSTALLTAAAWAIHGSDMFPGAELPRSIPIIDGMLTLLAVGGIRFAVRAGRLGPPARRHSGKDGKKRVLVVGAGDAGAMIVRELRSSSRAELDPVGFVDDAPEKQGVYVHGVPVLGRLSDILRVIEHRTIDEVIIAMPTAPGKIIRETVAVCEAAGIPSLTVPGMFEILTGDVSVNQLRNVEIEDLLRREPVQTDSTEIMQMLTGARILVTGAGGSIGSELCRQILRAGPAQLVLLGHGENSLFVLNQDLRHLFPQAKLQIVVADIRDSSRINAVFARFRPQIVFHAAAHKHVPLMEDNIEEAVTNNVLGTRIVTEVAEKYDVERLVAISSDKAVNPTSIMGATKLIAELIVHEAGLRARRPFVSVRFGNVLGSRGSVVPFFRQQIANGGPVTVTHPDITRYFMTIPEAVQLVLQAGTMGRPGDLFVLDMGSPIRIVDLARDLIRLSGLEEGRDIDIVFTGLRPGEKLNEELFTSQEKYGRTAHEKIFMMQNGHQSPAGPAYGTLQAHVNELVSAAQLGNTNIRSLINRIVSECQSSEYAAEPAATVVESRRAPAQADASQPVAAPS
jgi:FlaA1/EpsC-like NDP-sugar epimerase